MPSLLFEIWSNPDDESLEMCSVTPQADEARRKMAPRSVRLHSFRARSDFEAFRINNRWHGWEPWTPESGWPEIFYTVADQEEQDEYLRLRDV